MRLTRWRVLLGLALLALWGVGTLDRAAWTPDEPREADIAWRMSWQAQKQVPQLAGVAFLEKPPLSWWASGAAIRYWGDSPAAARVPNLVYAPLTAAAVGALTFLASGSLEAACGAAVLLATALLSWRVSMWLAPDAALLAGCSVALLGAWLGVSAAPGRRKLLGYGLMHLGAAVGFMAKSAPGWLVPALALLALIVWERRWSELRRPELYAGLLLQALLIGPWLISVASLPDGPYMLRVLFWHNLVGRFTALDAPPGLDYAHGHPNSAGKYLLELPVYLLPWTPLVIAALMHAWRAVRDGRPDASAWRFSVCATLPFLVLLSCAGTARDVYAAPALPGLALLVGLWLAAPGTRRVTGAVILTQIMASVLLVGLAAALALLAFAGAGSRPVLLAAACLTAAAACGLVLIGATCAGRRHGTHAALASIALGYVLGLTVACAAAFPVIDRWQDLPSIARAIGADTQGRTLALLDPDETTVAMLDHGLRIDATRLAGEDAPRLAAGWLRTHPQEGRLLVLLPGHAPGPLTPLLGPVNRSNDGLAGSLLHAGMARLVRRYELPHGRRYALLAAPGSESPGGAE